MLAAQKRKHRKEEQPVQQNCEGIAKQTYEGEVSLAIHLQQPKLPARKGSHQIARAAQGVSPGLYSLLISTLSL